MESLSFSELSLEEKIGQLFFIGIQGTDLNPDLKQLLDEIKPGGICFFARNIRQPAQTRQLIDDISGISQMRPFFSIDQEGGLVDRLRRLVTPMPAPSKFSKAAEVRRLARITASLLRALGFNMNFAPVVDVIDDRRAAFSNGLYSRTFGRSKETAADFAGAYLDELEAGGVIGCLKHFPGLGATEVDSHEELPTVKISSEELFEVDLYPYRELLARSRVSAVMVAHAAFPSSNLQETDQNGKLLPSSLNSNFIDGLLRQQLGYQNLVVTDDLEMGAIVKNYGIGEACKMAFKAGEDMLTICADPQAIREGFKTMLAAAEKGEISTERIDLSLARIRSVKNSLSEPESFSEASIRTISEDIAALNKDLD